MRLRRPTVVATAALTAIAVLGIAPTASADPPTDLFISEYIEGSSNNKAIEIFNGTGAPVDLAPASTRCRCTSTATRPPALTIELTGTVADGDVFVLAQAVGGRGDPGPGRPDQRLRAGSTATTRSCCARAAAPDGHRLDRPGRRRPRHRVGHRA